VGKIDFDLQHLYSATYQLLRSRFLSLDTRKQVKKLLVSIDEEMNLESEQRHPEAGRTRDPS
jgi:hypothetical protein